MAGKSVNISLALGWNERYDHKIAVGVIKFSHQEKHWRLSGNDWLFRRNASHDQEPDGMIARITNREEHKRILSFGVPVVDIANAYADSELPRALNDDFATGVLATEHLMKKGYAHLGFVGINETSWSNMRMEGMRSMMAKGATQHCYNVGISWLKREPNINGLIRWLEKIPLPCGLLAANDLLGYRITVAAKLAGISIPSQLGVIGVDNDDVFCQLANPTLTSVACDCEGIGFQAANLLAKILSGTAVKVPVIVPPLGIVERESTNLRQGRDEVVAMAKNFIHMNIAKGINVNDVVAACSISRRALERRFHSREGCSLHSVIYDSRLEFARSLLAGGRNASEASRESGFRTVQHFHYAFKKKYDMTPKDYIASIDRKENNATDNAKA